MSDAPHAQLRALTRCCRALLNLSERDEILEYAAAAALTLANANESVVFLHCGEVVFSAKAIAGQSSTPVEPVDGTLAEALAAGRDSGDGCAAVTVPMHASEEMIGALVVRTPGGSRLDAGAAWCMQAFADQVAAAIEHAELVRRDREPLRREVAKAPDDAARHPEIVSALSHEARSPLMVLDLGCDALRESLPDATAEQLDLLSQLRAARQRLQLLVENLVEMRRMELGLLTIRPKTITLRSAIDAAADVVAPNCVAKRQRLMIECEPALRALGDANRVRHIVQNLLGNANKFGPVDSEIRIVATREPGDTVAVDVLDEGPGIEADEREYIFLPYQGRTAPGSSTHVGLGLTVARELARRMGGDVSVDVGGRAPTRFTLRLRVQPPKPCL